jgi:hypothetical protein
MTERQIDPHAAVDYMLQNAPLFAQAKASRVYLEEYRKTKKAMLMQKAPPECKSVADREAYAYAHPEYLEVLAGIRVALEDEETRRFCLKAAELRVEIWRSTESSNRAEGRVVR